MKLFATPIQNGVDWLTAAVDIISYGEHQWRGAAAELQPSPSRAATQVELLHGNWRWRQPARAGTGDEVGRRGRGPAATRSAGRGGARKFSHWVHSLTSCENLVWTKFNFTPYHNKIITIGETMMNRNMISLITNTFTLKLKSVRHTDWMRLQNHMGNTEITSWLQMQLLFFLRTLKKITN